jgi:sugar phosphate isomerase/epimerase
MAIYISTGGFVKISAAKAIEKLYKTGIKDIELSGGKYEPNLLKQIEKYKKLNLKVHNYFPPPKKPFVLNFASLDKYIYEKSENLVLKAINFSKKIKSNYYSFHAGFLCDIIPSDLGKNVKKKKLNSRRICTELFIERVKKISKVAKNSGVKLMIENNVITKNNLLEFGENPFLMSEPKETKKILNLLPDNVGMLLDVAHLKVSAKTLGFNRSEMFLKCKNKIFGYHLSENNGSRDSNEAFDENSWFWKFIPKESEYVSIEVYENQAKKLFNLLKLAKNKLSII